MVIHSGSLLLLFAYLVTLVAVIGLLTSIGHLAVDGMDRAMSKVNSLQF